MAGGWGAEGVGGRGERWARWLPVVAGGGPWALGVGPGVVAGGVGLGRWAGDGCLGMDAWGWMPGVK